MRHLSRDTRVLSPESCATPARQRSFDQAWRTTFVREDLLEPRQQIFYESVQVRTFSSPYKSVQVRTINPAQVRASPCKSVQFRTSPYKY